MKYLIIGSKGQLGKCFEENMEENNLNFLGVGIEEMDITDKVAISEVFEKVRPNIVINCSAYNLVDQAEETPEMAYRVNKEGVRNIAEECKKHNCFLVHYGTNYIFDGTKDYPYTERDKPNPINKYGESKLAGERIIQERLNEGSYLIFRLSWLYGKGHQNFIYKFLQRVKNGDVLMGTEDEIATPTSTETVVEVTMRALREDLPGDIYHLTNTGQTSRWGWAKKILETIKEDKKIQKVSIKIFNLLAERPRNAVLDNSKISKDLEIQIPSWDKEVEKFIKETL